MIGSGFPAGVLARRADVMDPLAENVLFPHSGTYSANPVTMVAGYTAMNMFDRDAVNRLNELGEFTRKRIAGIIETVDVPAFVTGAGSMFRIHMQPDAPNNYRESFATKQQSRLTNMMLDHLSDHGFILFNTCSGALSTVMAEHEIDQLSETLLDGFRVLKQTWNQGE